MARRLRFRVRGIGFSLVILGTLTSGETPVGKSKRIRLARVVWPGICTQCSTENGNFSSCEEIA